MSDVSSWNDRVERLLEEVARIESEERRRQFLHAACEGHPALEQEVVELLPYYLSPNDVLETLPVETISALFSEIDTPIYDPPSAVLQQVLASLDPTDEPDAIGRLGEYDVTRVVGQGAMGVVLAARDAKLHRPVAIKVLAPHLAARPEYRAQFLSEARAMASVNSPYVVTIHSVDDCRDLPFLVMEYVTGESLRNALRYGTIFSLHKVASFGRQLALGIAAIHEQQIVHRDIKPANILVDEHTGQPKITDFSVALLNERRAEARPAGTLPFMAPEQTRGGPIDHRADLYALGCVLRAMLGQDALPVDPESVHRRRPMLALRSGRAASGSVVLRSLIEELLAPDPDDRPPAAVDVAERLQAVEERLTKGFAMYHVSRAVRQLVARPKRTMIAFCAFILVAAAALLPTTIERVRRWQYARRHVVAFDLYDRHERWLWQTANARLATEPTGDRYWRPASAGRWGEIVYRIEFPEPLASCRVAATVTLWPRQPLAEQGTATSFGKPTGAQAEMWLSGDGRHWILADPSTLTSGQGPVIRPLDYTLTEPVRGRRTVYVKARLFSLDLGGSVQGQPIGPAYAQFLRSYDPATRGPDKRKPLRVEARFLSEVEATSKPRGDDVRLTPPAAREKRETSQRQTAL